MKIWNFLVLTAASAFATWAADRLLTQNLAAPVSWLPWFPLVGPWSLVYGQTQIAAPSSTTVSLLVIDGLLQAGGLTVGILGFVLHRKRLVMSLPPPPPPLRL